ncbi:AraC family transcriptional regulator [Rhizobium rhizogenes]|nr:AraC family transcriptional regulator [Rhizobium rhizogenes]NTH33011.1 AraC family transcriptional regulator [Rhizobium rhizogenes]NTI36227.1 AraC family transcriptional regulator [Rhizobium rhizogenes]QRM38866.1 AraC family transcriptional regulator [Rhizobium rhizogenes]
MNTRPQRWSGCLFWSMLIADDARAHNWSHGAACPEVNMSINLEIRQYAGPDRHRHDYSQILFPMRGSMLVDVEGRADVVSSNSLAIIPQDRMHNFVPSADCSLMVMDVELTSLPDALVPSVLSDASALTIKIEPWLWRLFNQLGREVEADGRRAPDVAHLALSGLQLLKQEPATAAASRSLAERRVLDAAGALGNDLGQTSVTNMARKAGLGQSQFHALFREAVGQSPRQYQLRKLFDRAVDLLVNTSLPISEIAYDLGYRNASSFNRQFKQRFGLTPSAFRNADADGRSVAD